MQESKVTWTSKIAFDCVAIGIFVIVSLTFIFPCNVIVPFDRRTIAVTGATMCYITRSFIFAGSLDILEAIDFDVLVLLASIMAINHVLVHLKETKRFIEMVQIRIQKNPSQGFWLVSFLAFILAPFLTNDGVCLLFVEIILNAFPSSGDSDKRENQNLLEKSDAIYFLLSLACSANIGSALTYTGNPQNMIVAQDSIGVLPPIKFLGYMLLPATVAWVSTTMWIQRSWVNNKNTRRHSELHQEDNELVIETPWKLEGSGGSVVETSSHQPINPLSPRKQRKIERELEFKKAVFSISSPFPYMIFIMSTAMITLIFLDIMPIAGLVCTGAVVMTGMLVIGNWWRGKEMWQEEGDPALGNVSHEERLESIDEFFESLFQSIDYSLLLIFLGTFVVVANVESTGLPKKVWDKIVGDYPFQTASSIIGISIFTLISSQLLGNVAVVQLALPNVHNLGDNEKRFAWAVISFVATVGGNLTITGSAANIIVAEKVSRLDPTSRISFYQHYKVCFWITLANCGIGALIISFISMYDKQ